jgi:hypothetical protein
MTLQQMTLVYNQNINRKIPLYYKSPESWWHKENKLCYKSVVEGMMTN